MFDLSCTKRAAPRTVLLNRFCYLGFRILALDRFPNNYGTPLHSNKQVYLHMRKRSLHLSFVFFLPVRERSKASN